MFASLERAKDKLKKIQRDRKFKKANLERERQVDLQVALADCRGELTVCQKDFKHTIQQQSESISVGIRTGKDTALQEKMLYEAALGYMLVEDAIYSLTSINTANSVSHAYELLDEATRVISGKSDGFLHKYAKEQERNRFGFATSQATLKAKEELLDSFFEDLKITGDIEACLATARNPRETESERRAYANGSLRRKSTDSWLEDDDDDEPEVDILGKRGAGVKFHPPEKNTKEE